MLDGHETATSQLVPLRFGQPTTIVLADANKSRLAVATFCLMVICVVSRIYLLSGSSELDFDWNNIESLYCCCFPK